MEQKERYESASDRLSFLNSLRNTDPGFESKNAEDEGEEVTFEEQNADTVRATNLSATNTSAPTSDLLSLFHPPLASNRDALPPTSLPPRAPTTTPNDDDDDYDYEIPIENPRLKSPKPSVLRGAKKPQPLPTRARSVSFDQRAINKSEVDELRNIHCQKIFIHDYFCFIVC